MAEQQVIKVPDIGGTAGVDVIEILVKVGDHLSKETPLVTLESDKASMEIPSPVSGVVQSIQLKLGDKVSEGDAILTLLLEEGAAAEPKAVPAVSEEPALTQEVEHSTPEKPPQPEEKTAVVEPLPVADLLLAAGPAARRLARELGVNLSDVSGTGRKDRVSKADIVQFVKNRLSSPASGAGLSMPLSPTIDFTRFGEIEIKPLSKIKRLTGLNLHRSWVTIPHVTQFDEADITDLEAFRQLESNQAQAAGYKLTLLAFVCKVVSKALITFPQFNASLDPQGEQLIYKKYCHIGIAVETPNGLVVPVIKDVNTLSVGDIAKEMARLSLKARDKGLSLPDLSGGCFTVSSLGGIGGTAFTPIVNSPEVAILGLSRSAIKPIYIAGEFKPRLMLPLSLSYDHRVIDGAEAARFTRFIADSLCDIRRILL